MKKLKPIPTVKNEKLKNFGEYLQTRLSPEEIKEIEDEVNLEYKKLKNKFH